MNIEINKPLWEVTMDMSTMASGISTAIVVQMKTLIAVLGPKDARKAIEKMVDQAFKDDSEKRKSVDAFIKDLRDSIEAERRKSAKTER